MHIMAKESTTRKLTDKEKQDIAALLEIKYNIRVTVYPEEDGHNGAQFLLESSDSVHEVVEHLKQLCMVESSGSSKRCIIRFGFY